jgi:hypothetical protein
MKVLDDKHEEIQLASMDEDVAEVRKLSMHVATKRWKNNQMRSADERPRRSQARLGNANLGIK